MSGMNENDIYELGGEDTAEALSLMYERDSRRLSSYIDAEKEARL